MKETRLKIIQKEILDKLGLPHPPNVTSQNILKLPPVKELIESEKLNMDAFAEELHEDNYHAKTQKIILFSETGKYIADKLRNLDNILVMATTRDFRKTFQHYRRKHIINFKISRRNTDLAEKIS